MHALPATSQAMPPEEAPCRRRDAAPPQATPRGRCPMPATYIESTSDDDIIAAWTPPQADPKAVVRRQRANAARSASTRRRNIDPTTCDREYSAEELEFMHAMQEYKQQSGRMFPTWSEVLEVIQGL